MAACFFFSSRRRHTRCLSDWSSDVCSSDLPCSPAKVPRSTVATAAPIPARGSSAWCSKARSEERRVGKEGRCRSSPYHLNKHEEDRLEDALEVTSEHHAAAEATGHEWRDHS